MHTPIEVLSLTIRPTTSYLRCIKMGFSEKINPIIEAQHFSEKILNEKSPPLPLITYGKEDYLRMVEILPPRN